jgi:hypothetical protein
VGVRAELAVAIGVLVGCGGPGLFGSDTANTFGSSASMSAGEGTEGSGSASSSGSDDDDGASDGASDESASDATMSGPDDSGSGTGPGDELCNGIDDDGDGMIDENFGELSCGMGACAATAPACVGGVPGECVPLRAGTESCNAIDDDCDGTADEEVAQACSSACGSGTETCEAGSFVGCNAPQPEAEVCDFVDQDCDDAIDDGVGGCRQGVHRSWHAGTGEHFYTTSLEEAQCCGFTLETQDFYFIYIVQHAGLAQWNRCIKPNGMHFYTTDGGCEGTTFEGTIGYVATAAVGDARPLYRSYYGPTGDHFYTTSAAEHNAAVAGGHIDEGTVCWVW